MRTHYVFCIYLCTYLYLKLYVYVYANAQAGNFDLAIRYQKSLKAQMEMEKKRHLENCEGKLSDQRQVRVWGVDIRDVGLDRHETEQSIGCDDSMRVAACALRVTIVRHHNGIDCDSVQSLRVRV